MSARIVFSGDQVWIRKQDDQAVCLLEPSLPVGVPLWLEPLMATDGTSIEVVEAAADASLPAGTERVGLRTLFDLAALDDYACATRAFELLHWRRTHRFCGRCGQPLTRHATERAMACASCRDLVYPRTNPVVIVRITRGPAILLARRATGVTHFYSVIAGFVEAGETLEEAARREILEEVGLHVRDLRYFASQPWPYPNTLMIAFTAVCDSGEIHVDGQEIAEADWFTPDRLPALPHAISVSRRMIDAWLAGV